MVVKLPHQQRSFTIQRCLAEAMALTMLVCLNGCKKPLPTAPSELAAGIVVYEHVNFEGGSALITKDTSDLRDVKGPCQHLEVAGAGLGNLDVVYDWNDCISSVRVAPGWRAILYRDDGYRDDSVDIVEDVADLAQMGHDCPHGGLNDCVTSVRVRHQ